MVQSISKIVLKSRIKTANSLRKKNFLSWDKIDKIALILENEPNFSKHEIDTFIEQSKKYMEVYFVQTTSKQASYSDWTCFTKQDKSLFGLPKKSILLSVLGKKFDLVINTCKQDNLFATSIGNAALATLNCSTNKIYDEADIIMNRPADQKLIDYLKNMLTYLQMIKT